MRCVGMLWDICFSYIYIYTRIVKYIVYICIFPLVGWHVWGCMVAHRIKTCQVEASLSLTEQNDRRAFSPKLHIAVVMVGESLKVSLYKKNPVTVQRHFTSKHSQNQNGNQVLWMVYWYTAFLIRLSSQSFFFAFEMLKSSIVPT